jgi:hypothetical protein
MFDMDAPFNYFLNFVKELERNGQRLSVADYLYCVKTTTGQKPSILGYAIKHNRTAEIFHPHVWRGHINEMLELYSRVSAADKSKISIESTLSTLYDEEISKVFVIDGELTREKLCQTFNREAINSEFVQTVPASPLGLKRVWEDISKVRSILKGKQQSLSLEDLRQPSGPMNETGLQSAARYGAFREVLSMLDETGGRLSLCDLTLKTEGSKSVLEYLIDRGQLDCVFQAKLWSKPLDIAQLLNSVPLDKRKMAGDTDLLLARMNMDAVRPPRRSAPDPRP